MRIGVESPGRHAVPPALPRRATHSADAHAMVAPCRKACSLSSPFARRLGSQGRHLRQGSAPPGGFVCPPLFRFPINNVSVMKGCVYMYDHVSIGFITKFCSQAGQTIKIPTSLATSGSVFVAICGGCDFSCGLPVCVECRADNQRYWNRLRLKHPDLSAGQLASLPFDESI